MTKPHEIPEYSVATIRGKVVLHSGFDGQVIEQSSDASTIIQRAIDLLPRNGGKIYLAAGEYILNETIRIVDKHGIHLEGVSRGILFSGNKQGTVLRSEKNIDLVEVYGKTLKIAGTTISNLYVIGSGTRNGKAGILVNGCSDLLTLYNVGANNCEIGFHFLGDGAMMDPHTIDFPQMYFCDGQVNSTGMRIERAHYMQIVGSGFSDCLEYGIFISGIDSKSIICPKINSVSAVRNPKAGIYIGKYTEDVTVTGGTDTGGSSEGSGIVISGEGTNNVPVNVIVSQIHTYNNGQCGILVEAGKNVIIQGCISSDHPHEWVPAPGFKKVDQRFGVKICRGADNVIVNSCISYGNSVGDIVDETKKARIS